MSLTIEKTVHMSTENAARLGELARRRGTSEDELLEQALDLYFRSAETDELEERRFWQNASIPSFDRIWDNEEDAIYDNWRELYGVPER